MISNHYLFMLFLFFFVGLGGLVYEHEMVHQAIASSYNIDSYTDWIRFENGNVYSTTYMDEPCPTNECVLAHNINDIVGFLVNMLWIILFPTFIIKEINKYDNDG